MALTAPERETPTDAQVDEQKFSKALVAQGSKNVAAIDFTDLQGQPTELIAAVTPIRQRRTIATFQRWR